MRATFRGGVIRDRTGGQIVHRGGWRQAPLVGLAAVVLAVLVAQVAVAGSSNQGPRATASGLPQQKAFRNYKRKTDAKIAALQAQVNAIQGQPGPQGSQGPPGPPGPAPACQGNGSGDEMVAAGAVCIDKYEVSVWSSPTGGTQYGAESDDYPCNDNGQDCTNIYARSVPGVTPSSQITWFQAQQALANVGKRLPSNAEWQQAVAGTPDGAPCTVSGGSPVSTGSAAGCVSRFGANDMVGNLWEWVGDWDEVAGGCANWPADFGSDLTCLGRADTEASLRFPGALFRGGGFVPGGTNAGPFAVSGFSLPSGSGGSIGFRGAR